MRRVGGFRALGLGGCRQLAQSVLKKGLGRVDFEGITVVLRLPTPAASTCPGAPLWQFQTPALATQATNRTSTHISKPEALNS